MKTNDSCNGESSDKKKNDISTLLLKSGWGYRFKWPTNGINFKKFQFFKTKQINPLILFKKERKKIFFEFSSLEMMTLYARECLGIRDIT